MKKKNLFIVSLIFSLFLMTFSAFAYEQKNIPSVPINKDWTITFNYDISIQAFNNNIYIEDNQGELTLFEIDYKDISKSKRIFVVRTLLGYIPNSSYTLNIKSGIKSENGKTLKEDFKFKFNTLSNEESGF